MSNPVPSTGGVEISNIQLVNLPSGYRTYSVEISHNKKVKRKLQRKKVDGDRIVWFESLLFPSDLTDQSIFYFKIAKIFGVKMMVGSWNEKVTNLFQLQKDSGSCQFNFSGGCQIIFTIKQQDNILPQLLNEVDSIPAAAGTSTSEHSAKISNAVMKAHNTFTSQEDTWTPFLSQFGVFMNAIDTISEVHPYLKLAWSVLSIIPKTVISQSNRNDSINKLLQQLKEVYDYITDTNRLPTLQETQSKTLSVLVQQTIECAYFLREYGGTHISESFLTYLAGRVLTLKSSVISGKKILTGSSIDGKISDFNEKFTHILNVITNSVALETSIVTLRISKDVGETKDLTLLGDLPYAQDAGFSSDKCCLPGTRDKLITELLDWVNGDGSQQVLLLLGQAGRGKSAVAHTISQIFDIQNRLGAIFCFNRSYKDRRNSLFSTIARELADGDVQWRESLVQIIDKTSTRKSSDIQTQFNELIIKPSTEVNTIGPVVIVIDGLDESGDRTEREKLLKILQRCSELPSNYRFIITSRPELDIEEWSKHPTFVCKRMDDIDLDETTKDIQQYISSRFSRVKDILDKELEVGWSLLLARRAEGLFQWARTVCDFINPKVKYGVAKNVKKYILGPTPSLYELYHQVFDDQPEFDNNDFLLGFKRIMGALIIMRKPPSMQALQFLFREYDVNDIMQPFHSLFLSIHNLDTPIRPLHTSLPDFLTTRFIDIVDNKHDIKTKTKVQNKFYIDTSDHGYFTLACLKLMNSGESGLHFNICNLETSHKLNQDVLDLDDRIQAKIPSHLSYTCYFWAIHLQQSKKHSNFNISLLEELHILMRTNVLYLFEVLGLLQHVEQVCISMNILALWCEGVNSELVQQAQDTRQFGYDFEDIIMKSTPHLYISALPFTREDSFIRKQYLDSFPHHFTLDVGQSPGPLRNFHVVKRIDAYDCEIAFSPQGKYIATAFKSDWSSKYIELLLWNYRTGEMIRKWEKLNLPIHSSICSIVFSPNGESITVTSSHNLDHSVMIHILTCNIDRNEISTDEVSIPNDGQYCKVSDNVCYIVVHGTEKKSSLYDITARSEPRHLAFFSHSCQQENYETAISPNGDLVAFRSGDHMISLWSNPTQKVIGSLELSTEAGNVSDMKFFPDGSRIGILVDIHVEIWDVRTKTKVCRFGCDKYTSSGFAIFPDGQHLVFSSDETIYIWNVTTGNLVQSFATGVHVASLAVSPDCKHIASVRNDNTIQVDEWESISRTMDIRGLFYTEARLSPGGGYLILEGRKADQSYLQLLNTVTMSKLTDQVQLKGLLITAFSPGDRYIAYVATNGLCLWSIVRGEVVLDPDCDFTAIAFSSNSDYLISSDKSGNVIIWNTHSCQPSEMMTSKGHITALAFSATGTRFLVVYLSDADEPESIMEIEIHDSQLGKLSKGPFMCPLRLMNSYERFNDEQWAVAFSANESRIVCITCGEVFVIDAETGQILDTFEMNPMTKRSLMLSSNRKYLWIGSPLDPKEILWDIDERVEIEGQWLHSQPYITGFSNKPEELLTVHDTGAINFWNISTGNKTMTLMFHPQSKSELDWDTDVSSDGRFLVLTIERSIKVWSLEGRGECQAMSCVYENQAQVARPEEDIYSLSSSMLDERERKEYALVAWQKALFSASSEMDRNGWILGPDEEHLFWVPKERRAGLWRPNMVYGTGRAHLTRLNFDNFVHGSRWTECRKPLIS